jgi:phenylalanine ammonia-lyase
MLGQPAGLRHERSVKHIQDETSTFAGSLPLDDPVAATCMPESWVRASMLVRLNSLASGASGVRTSTANVLMQLLAHDIVPRIPIRGSISASGDLSPLSYVGGVMQGKPTLTVTAGTRLTGERRIVRADLALAEANITPAKLGAKEGLAIVNGTAISAGVAALAMHEVHCQTALSQVLTAMSVEALCGTDESFDPFFAKVRPHPGQEESARNIYAFLAESKLVHRSDGSEQASLRQDRYSIRTASQWIGPVLEDLLLAHNQVTIEVNSVSDNPLVDTDQNRMLHGGNFQAKAITSAMEKTRQSCQTIGRMLSVQCTELINPMTNRGLPPNLVIDEPSESFIWKGTDIMVAALQSELGFLANPVGTHVQTAEMGNQALNSLALISARYTLDAVDVLTQLSAVHLIALCQALDLRAINIKFQETFHPIFSREIHKAFEDCVGEKTWLDKCETALWIKFKRDMEQTTGIDSEKRFTSIMDSLQSTVLQFAPCSSATLVALHMWTERCSASALGAYNLTRERYISRPDATPLLGPASRRMYRYVRDQLGIPFTQEKTIRTPEPELAEVRTDGIQDSRTQAVDTPTVGSLMTAVYQSMRTGALYVPVMECLQEARW